MDREQFEQAEVKLNDCVGPFTAELNKLFIKSGGTSFFDYVFFHFDLFYLKYTKHIWQEQLGEHTESPITRKYGDGDMELANLCLYRFQTLCDQENLSTKNPISFFNSFDSYWQAAPRDFCTVAALFLWAVTDRKFLFDSAIQSSVPSIFITRTFVSTLGTSDNILRSSAIVNPKFDPLLETRYSHMQEQIRGFHLMLPSRTIYCDRWENFTLPVVRQLQRRNRMYSDFSAVELAHSINSSCRQQLIDIVMDCFIWYMASAKHLDIENSKELMEKVSYLQKRRESSESNGFKENIKMIVDLMINTPRMFAFPFFVYRILTKNYSKIEAEILSDVDRIVEGMRLPVNLEIKSTETSSIQWFRRNLLLFKLICHKARPLAPKNAVERSVYMFECSEGITLERYPADELLELDVMDSRVEEYIRKGGYTGDFVLPELAEIVNYVESNLNVSPFDILSYKAWNETPESLHEFMTSSKGGAGSGRGRKKTKAKLFAEIIPELANYQELKQDYFHLVFGDQAGYGSGMPTYEWAFRLTSLIDQIVNVPQLQNALRNELDSQKELVELGIHSFFLSVFSRETIHLIMCIGKRILYSDDIQELNISSEID